ALVGLALTVPGVIALRALRVPAERLLAYPVYVPAASLGVMLAAGLAGDLIAPALGDAHPLHGLTTAYAVLALALALWFAGLGSPGSARLPWRRALQDPLCLVPVALCPLSALGALLLSGGHGDAVARISILVDVAALFAGLLFAERLGRRRAVALLFSCGLAVAWSWSLRSQEIVGFDVSTELYVAQHTQAMGIWHTLHHNDPYGAMLSVTVLPSTLAALCGCSPLIALKVVFPLFSALLPVSIFLLGERLLSRRFAFFAAGLMLSQAYFFQQLPELARQEVALVFFAALVAAVLERGMRQWTQVLLAVAMALGVVGSHYSSTYLAIPLFAVALVARTAIARWRGLPVVAWSLLAATVALIAGAGVWYGVVTRSASNVGAFAATLEDRGLNLLPSDGSIVNTFLNGNNVRSVPPGQMQSLAVHLNHRLAPYLHTIPAARTRRYALRSSTVPATPERSRAAWTAVNTYFLPIYNELLLVAFSLGTIIMLVRRRGPPFAAELAALAFGALAFLVFIRFSATAAAAYNDTRALLQSLLLVAVPAAWLLQRLLARWRPVAARIGWVVLCGAVCLVFAQQSGAFSVALGGDTSLNLSASGEDFERYYETPAELSGARYAERAAHHSILYGDRYGQLRIFATSGRPALTEVMPRTLDRYAWIYGTRTNLELHRARAQIGNDYGVYR
ncbi:MAG: hypothetical protein ACRDK8_02635, partial [Solirubrobacteraceae bacterium]